MGARVKIETLGLMKQRGEPIAVLTCYDHPTAVFQDGAGVDVIFVGDSVGVNVLGYESPQQVTIDDMRHHTRAVRRGVVDALLMADLPYRSYETPAQAVKNARQLTGAGAEVVKLEGGRPVIDQVRALVSEGIPVVGHVGYTPQTRTGKRPVFGDRAEDALAVLKDAHALASAGALAVVLECVPERVVEVVTDRVPIPTIGIGAGRVCDGQVLVAHDMLGMHNSRYRFVKAYADLEGAMQQAFAAYVQDVKNHRFPQDNHRFKIKSAELRRFHLRAEDVLWPSKS